MPDDPTLQAQPSATDTSAPAEEVKVKAEEGDTQDAPQEEVKEGESDKPKPELTEVEKVKQSMQKRIDRLTAASKAREEHIRQLETKSVKAPEKDAAPKQDDFTSYDDWEQATIEHKAKLKADEHIQAETDRKLKEAREQHAAELNRQFVAKEAAFRTRTPDYDRVAGEAVEAFKALSQAGHDVTPLYGIVNQFDNPPEIIYQLGKDTALIDALVDMKPLQAMRELVKLEIALSASQEEQETAPEPIRPVGGKGGGSKPLHECSGADILKHLGL